MLTIGYDIENLSNPNLKYQYKGEVTIDRYGRKVPKHAHGTANLEKKTSSTRLITNAVMDLYDRIVDEHLLVRRITITANKLVDEKSVTALVINRVEDVFFLRFAVPCACLELCVHIGQTGK